MQTTLTTDVLESILSSLEGENRIFARHYPGEPEGRQPVHTVYGGAHLFKSDTAKKIAQLALAALDEHAPDGATLARVLGLDAALGDKIRSRVAAKLKKEAVEDFRLDYEDGYGARPDPEEDGHAVSGAKEVAVGLAKSTLPPFIGIRIKPLSEELKRRSLRTLDLFVSTLLDETKNRLPHGFVVTLPKVQSPGHVSALVRALEAIESARGLAPNTLKMEIMVELTQTIFAPDGSALLPKLLEASKGRMIAAHFGTYDYTASCGITAAHQRMSHPACDFARHMMQVCFARTGIFLSDGATNVMPIGGREVVHRAWKLSYDHIRDSLVRGFYQGWDLHPAQVPIRYAAMYAFFLEGLDAAGERLRNFVQKAAQATLVGDVFDDAATGQGLLNYFLRAMSCGALTEDEATKLSGLSLDELRGRSFVKILERRRGA
jgi:citrate lyase beta subunit